LRRLSRRRLIGLAAASPAIGLVACVGSSGQMRGLKGLAVPSFVLDARSEAELDADFRWMVEAGVDWLRFDLYWSDVEAASTQRDWSATDRIVTAAGRHRLRLLAVVHTVASDVQSEGASAVTVPSGSAWIDHYARFCAEAASRFRGRIAAWELWNEPNLVQFWAPRPSVAVYAVLVRAAAAAIKSVDAAAIVVSGGLGGAGGDDRDIDAGEFLNATVASGCLQFVDAVAVHPYPRLQPDGFDTLSQVADAAALLRGQRDVTQLLWGTETGAPSTGLRGVGERVQAELVNSTYRQWVDLENRGPLFWYTLRDFATGSDSDRYGLFRDDGSAKPAAGVFASLGRT